MFQNLAPGAIHIRCEWTAGLDLAQQAGFAGADVNIVEAAKIANEQSVEAVRALFASRSLQMGAWNLPVNCRSSEVEFYPQLRRLPAAAELAAELGCFRTNMVVLGWSDDLTRQQNWRFQVKRLRELCTVLRDYGHRLGLEFIGPRTSRAPKKYGFVYTMDGMLALCCAIGTGNVGLLFDVWHWYTCQSTLDDVRKLTKDDVVYVHLNDAPADRDVLDQIDNQRCLPGETGVIPNGELLKILQEIGYDGPVTAEPFNAKVREAAERNPIEAARMTKESLDKVWGEAGLG